MNYKELRKLEYLSKQYNETNIPLYLSYPITSWWKDRIDNNINFYEYKNHQPPFLYFHFPYCKQACYYCACCRSTSKNSSDNEIYLDYLKKEINQKLNHMGVDRISGLRHMHWGGGTPTYMTCRQIEQAYLFITKRIILSENENTSLSIEAYPDEKDITEEKLRLLRLLGFNEISIGVQDFDKQIQHVINRKVRPIAVQKLVAMAKDFGFRVHVDLCYGLPFQGLNEIERTVKEIILMEPDRIALNPYAHYPEIIPMQNRIPRESIPNSFMRVLLFKKAEELFAANGYQKISFDHFVKKENSLYTAWDRQEIIRDFMGCSLEERKDMLGFGNGAISFLGDKYLHNVISIDDYYCKIDSNQLPFEPQMAHYLTDDDRIRNELIQKNLMCNFRIDKKQLQNKYKIDFNLYFEQEKKALSVMEIDGLIQRNNDNEIKVTQVGQYFVRHIAHAFDTYYRYQSNQKQAAIA